MNLSYQSRNGRYYSILKDLLEQSPYIHRTPARLYDDMISGVIDRDMVNSDLYLLYLDLLDSLPSYLGNRTEVDTITSFFDRSHGHAKLFIAGRDIAITTGFKNMIAGVIGYRSSRTFGVTWKVANVDSSRDLSEATDANLLILSDYEDNPSLYHEYLKRENSFNSILDVIITDNLQKYSNDIDAASSFSEEGCIIVNMTHGLELTTISVYGEKNHQLLNLIKNDGKIPGEVYTSGNYLLDNQEYSLSAHPYLAIDTIIDKYITDTIIQKIHEDIVEGTDLKLEPWKFSSLHMLVHKFLQPIVDTVDLEKIFNNRFVVDYDEYEGFMSYLDENDENLILDVFFSDDDDSVKVISNDGEEVVFDSSDKLIESVKFYRKLLSGRK